MGRLKSASKKRGTSTFSKADIPASPTCSIAAPPTRSASLRSVLRVRLPPTAKNGTIMTVYTPGLPTVEETSLSPIISKSPETKKKVRIVVEGESPTQNGDSSSSPKEQSFAASTSNAANSSNHSVADECLPDASISSGASYISSQSNSKLPPSTSNHSSVFKSSRSVISTETKCATSLPDWMVFGHSYKGFCHFNSSPAPYDCPVPRVHYSSITPKEFFDQFVSKRRPCILTVNKEEESDLQTLLNKWVCNNYLKEKAGSCKVDVEVREHQNGEQFGEGRRTEMEFGSLLDGLENGETKYYVTTQRIKETKKGPTRLGGDVLHKTSLTDDFPNVPSIMGNLVLYQHNIWIGHSVEGSSTGLHHDYHDNLYVTIRGKKRFRLYSPRCAEILSPVGRILKIHENGLISYDAMKRSDGADESCVLNWRKKQTESEVKVLEGRLASINAQIKKLESLVKGSTKAAQNNESKTRRNGKGQQKLQINDPKTLRIEDLGSKKLMAIAKEFLLTPIFSIANLQSELNSKMESKRLVEDYIQSAKSKYETFLELKADADLRRKVEEALDDEGDNSESENEMAYKNECHNKEDTVEGNEHTPSLSFLESSIDKKTKNSLDLKRQQIQNVLQKNNGSSAAAENVKENLDFDEHDDGWNTSDDDGEDGENCTEEITADFENVKPSNFCEVTTIARNSTTLSLNQMISSFPDSDEECPIKRFSAIQQQMLSQYIEVSLNPNELLYLPASWFHEVISSSNTSEESSSGHMAFNFWFYPPASPTATFQTPYSDEYWSHRYRQVCERAETEEKLRILQQFKSGGGFGWASLVQLFNVGISPEILGNADENDMDFTELLFDDDEAEDDENNVLMRDNDESVEPRSSKKLKTREKKKRRTDKVESLDAIICGRNEEINGCRTDSGKIHQESLRIQTKISQNSNAVKVAYQKHQKLRERSTISKATSRGIA